MFVFLYLYLASINLWRLLKQKGAVEEQTRLENLVSEIQADIDAGKTVDAKLKLQSLEWTYTVGMGGSDDVDSDFSKTRREWEGKKQVLEEQLDKVAKKNKK